MDIYLLRHELCNLKMSGMWVEKKMKEEEGGGGGGSGHAFVV